MSPIPTPERAGWWALDVAAYLLTPLSRLGGISPAALDVTKVISWIRATELGWAPGDTRLQERPWSALRCLSTDAELVDWSLEEASCEARRLERVDAFRLAARRRLPETTLRSPRVTRAVATPVAADVHVHQGAALPIEVTLHWVAASLTSIAEGSRFEARPLCDIDGEHFHGLPLLLLLRGVLVNHPEWRRCVPLAQRAARAGGQDAWDELATIMSFDEATDFVADVGAIRQLKERAAREWLPERRVTLLRIEAILHAAITQQTPGLDVFVGLFEDLAALRRRRFPKRRYYASSIRTHADQTPGLRALELRLGEMIHAERPHTVEGLAAEYASALRGYATAAEGADRVVRVSFPLGLVKTRGPRRPSQHWRVNPSGGYELVESLIELLAEAPALAPYVDGLDVCGNEEDAPNWLFAPMFKRFGDWSAAHGGTPAFRFHAGEWQWTPLHGLRRIAEFLAFDLPARAPRRVGHALALASDDWSRLGEQPVDELLDDLVWASHVLDEASAPDYTRRLVARTIDDVLPFVLCGRGVIDPRRLYDAYIGRTDIELLQSIGFASVEDARLAFPDHAPTPGPTLLSQLLTGSLVTRRDEVPTVGSVATEIPGCGGVGGLEMLALVLSDAYELAVEAVMRDLRWGGVVVEACPTSNVITGGVRGYARHPMPKMLREGLNVAVGSDDPSLFHSWLADELSIVRDSMRVPESDIVRSQRQAARIVAPIVRAEGQLDQVRTALRELEPLAPEDG